MSQAYAPQYLVPPAFTEPQYEAMAIQACDQLIEAHKKFELSKSTKKTRGGKLTAHDSQPSSSSNLDRLKNLVFVTAGTTAVLLRLKELLVRNWFAANTGAGEAAEPDTQNGPWTTDKKCGESTGSIYPGSALWIWMGPDASDPDNFMITLIAACPGHDTIEFSYYQCSQRSGSCRCLGQANGSVLCPECFLFGSGSTCWSTSLPRHVAPLHDLLCAYNIIAQAKRFPTLTAS